MKSTLIYSLFNPIRQVSNGWSEKHTPIVWEMPELSRIPNGNGQVNTGLKCMSNPSFWAIKSPGFFRARMSENSDLLGRSAFLFYCSNTTMSSTDLFRYQASKNTSGPGGLTFNIDGLLNNHPLPSPSPPHPSPGLRGIFYNTPWPLTPQLWPQPHGLDYTGERQTLHPTSSLSPVSSLLPWVDWLMI